MNFRAITAKISAFFNSERGAKFQKWAERLINLSVLLWLIYQLYDIGWQSVWQSFPIQPLFYILFLLIFLQLPLFEILIYRLTWTFDAIKSIPIFILKRVYNKDVLGYSGELYFFTWAKKSLPIKGKEILKIIKDNNIISAIASTLVSFGLLALFVYGGLINIKQWISNINTVYIIAGAVLAIVIAFLFMKFRHTVISMPLKTAYTIFGIQMGRLVLGQVLQLLMYYVVLPEVPLHIWFTYLAIQIILSRIPFLPSKDLIFAGIGISIAGPLAISQQDIAGLMIALGALNKISGFLAFGVTKMFYTDEVAEEMDEDAQKAEVK